MSKKVSQKPALDLAELAAEATHSRSMVKTGKAPISHHFEADVAEDTTIVSAELTESQTDGKLQLALQVAVGSEGAGTVWVNMPAEGEENVDGKDDDRWMEFVRACYPGVFDVYASVDRSDPKEWKYIDSNGDELSYPERKAKGTEVSAAALALASRTRKGAHSFEGVTLSFWPKMMNNGKLFYRFRAAGFEPGIEG